MFHSFDTKIAKAYGMQEAVILENLYFWISKNRANGKNFHDGTYWTYNSIKAMSELFEYLSEKQIRTAIKHLIDNGLIRTGKFNKSSYDHTLWYALTKKGEAIFSSRETDIPSRENRSSFDGNSQMTLKSKRPGQKGNAIPYINTYNKKNNNTSNPGGSETDLDELLAQLDFED